MLVLSRRRNEAIMIGDHVEITVVDIRGDKVRLGIRAPISTAVHRKEVFESIYHQQKAADKEVLNPPSGDLFLQAAIDEAKKGLAEGGLPIGSVLVRGDQIVARGHSRRVQHGDPTAHAVIDCLTNAARETTAEETSEKTFKDTVLYSTLMPCHLCSGAAVQFGVPKVVVGESVNYPGDHKTDFLRLHGIEIVDLHDTQCIEMMSSFIREHSDLWDEHFGQ